MTNQLSKKADAPKLLSDPAARAARVAQLREDHIAPLTDFVQALRDRVGTTAAVPFFDPWDAGVKAEILFLLEAPGAKAVASGFVSRNNPDETAKNFFELNEDAAIPRSRTIIWNIVPWYIGNGERIRPADSSDIAAGSKPLLELLSLLPNLRSVVLVGRKAERAAPRILEALPSIQLFRAPHPSPLFVNNRPGNRERILTVLRQVAASL